MYIIFFNSRLLSLVILKIYNYLIDNCGIGLCQSRAFSMCDVTKAPF